MDDPKVISKQLAGVEDARALLEGLFLHSPMAYQVYRADGVSMLVNPAFLERFGAPPPEYNVFEDEILERNGFLALVRRAFAGETIHLPAQWSDPREPRKDAKRNAIQVTLCPLPDANGAIRHVAVCTKDVTSELELHAREGERNVREERLRLAFEAANMVAWDLDLSGGRLSVSDNAWQALGLDPDDRLDSLEDALRLVHPDDLAEVQGGIDRVRAGSPMGDARFRMVAPRTGQVRWFERRSRVEGSPARGDPWVRGIIMDVTERVAAEEALRISEARYRTQFEAAPEAIVTLDADAGTFIEANQHAERLLGVSREQLLRMNPLDISPPLQPDGRSSSEGIREMVRQTLAGERPVFEWLHRNVSTGELIPCEIRLVRLPGGLNLCRGSIIDISERKRAEAERQRLEEALRRAEEHLRQSQKMEAIGRLAGGIAHDFNNFLSVILGYCDILLADMDLADAMRGDLEAIRRSGQRAADLTHQLLAFSRQQVLALRVLDLNEVVQNADKMLRRLLGEDVDLQTRQAAGSVMVRVDPGQMDQVIMNLAINARDAMPNGGKLILETSRQVLDAAYASDHPDVSPGSYVSLAVIDTGGGMAPQTQERIFEPFFTTKERGKGTGLGLSTVFGIVQQSGGHIDVHSEPGRGTTFRIFLPESSDAKESAPEPTEPTTLHGTETILLVEDQEEVRQVAQEILRRYGYQVIGTTSVEEALLLGAGTSQKIDLLLTDVVMPRMSGPELAQQMGRLRPGLKVIFMSGYSEQAIAKHGVLDAAAAYLQKPLIPAVLARRVREVLDGGSRPPAPVRM